MPGKTAPVEFTTQLDDEFIKKVRDPILRVWDHCEPDAGRVKNSEAIEIAIDANRLTSDGNKEIDDLIGLACKEHGYKKVHSFLTRKIRLVSR